MKRIFLYLILLMSFVISYAKPLCPDSDSAKSEVELGVEGIQRLCPTDMWDQWTFRDIMFDRESNTVILIIQLNSWREADEDISKQMTETEAQKQAEWIVANFKEAYEELIKNPSVRCDGDFMLYLTLGTLFKQMEKDNHNLRIMILKPDQVALAVPVKMAKNEVDAQCIVNPKNIIGDWFAQIDLPQAEMTVLMEMNIFDWENCVIKCRWSKPDRTKEEAGKAKYKLRGNQLIITFLNEEELIRTDNVFDMENIYDITLTKDKLTILDNRQFRNVDVDFGRGYEKRRFVEIIFPED